MIEYPIAEWLDANRIRLSDFVNDALREKIAGMTKKVAARRS